ncbi:MAG: tripartite tricarboxylate transporter substrate binding protein [Spirochaetia bacterium]|nr:tripartite tricarboxylate transporter substrate binding protein [Spirochaetia bacterium]MCF7940602.1 tripartite tricarboxylate transporter substrate binding protein [Spirochaetia bacterium]
MKKIGMVLCVLILVAAGTIYAQGGTEAKAEYPTKTINLVVPFSAGGGTDAVGRALAHSVEKYLDQSVVVVNKTGGSGAVGMTFGATSTPDGYTVTMVTREIISLPLMGLAQIDDSDFDLVRLVNMDPALLCVKPGSKYEDLSKLFDDAQAKPGTVKFASPAAPNLYVLAIENGLQVSFNHIPYNGASEAIPSVLGGHTDFVIASPGELIGQIEAGQLKPVAIMAPERFDALPEVPTFSELGYELVSGTWRGLGVPKGTPELIRTTLEEAFNAAIKDPEFVSFMKNAKLGIYNLSSEDFASFIESDTRTIASIVEAM